MDFTLIMRLTKEQKLNLGDLYSTGKFTFTDLSKEFNKPISSIKYILNSMGYVAKPQTELKRKYYVNTRYFQNIDTCDKAYFLGWIFSDGNINIKNNCLRISLKESDKEVLVLLKKLIKSEKPLKFINVDKKREGFEKSEDQFLLEISSKEIIKDLLAIGVRENKSINSTFPTISEDLYPYFIRGYFEGDGWFTNTLKTKQFGIIGSKEFIKPLQELLSCYGIKMNINKKGKMFTLTCGGKLNENYKKFFNIVYKDNTELSLRRKYEKLAQEIY